MAKRKRTPRDLFSARAKGTEITITVDAWLLHIVDGIRSEMEELSGIQAPRKAVLEGLLRRN